MKRKVVLIAWIVFAIGLLLASDLAPAVESEAQISVNFYHSDIPKGMEQIANTFFSNVKDELKRVGFQVNDRNEAFDQVVEAIRDQGVITKETLLEEKLAGSPFMVNAGVYEGEKPSTVYFQLEFHEFSTYHFSKGLSSPRETISSTVVSFIKESVEAIAWHIRLPLPRNPSEKKFHISWKFKGKEWIWIPSGERLKIDVNTDFPYVYLFNELNSETLTCVMKLSNRELPPADHIAVDGETFTVSFAFTDLNGKESNEKLVAIGTDYPLVEVEKVKSWEDLKARLIGKPLEKWQVDFLSYQVGPVD
ncbi:MAG TPA: hypothetical protein P5560_08530 [Thermotogota bacterium]|nr:hypothetical protein [Thermotogota bacterium]